eukprot:6459056-Amphidinium_carterae.1
MSLIRYQCWTSLNWHQCWTALSLSLTAALTALSWTCQTSLTCNSADYTEGNLTAVLSCTERDLTAVLDCTEVLSGATALKREEKGEKLTDRRTRPPIDQRSASSDRGVEGRELSSLS